MNVGGIEVYVGTKVAVGWGVDVAGGVFVFVGCFVSVLEGIRVAVGAVVFVAKRVDVGVLVEAAMIAGELPFGSASIVELEPLLLHKNALPAIKPKTRMIAINQNHRLFELEDSGS